MYVLHQIDDWASLIIRLALEEMALPYRLHKHDFDTGSLDTATFRALNPQGLIPVLETPDGPIFETAAILLWLADRHGLMAPAPQATERAAFLSWLLFVSNTLHTTVMAQIHPERLAGEAAGPIACQAAFARLQGQCALLETIMGKAPAWLNADAPSILSPYLAVLLRWAQVLAADPACNLDLGPYPALREHLARLEARPAFLRVSQAEALGPTPFSNPQV
jgi:glutathione S-transferase